MGLIDRIRAWWSAGRIDPNQPHQFRSVDALAAPAATNELGTIGGSQAPILALATDAMRDRCQVRGCGRPAADPIHA